MTLNIINEIKNRSSLNEEPNELSRKCSKVRKLILPLKWVSLLLLSLLPAFTLPNWCIKAEEAHDAEAGGDPEHDEHEDPCHPEEYPDSGIPKVRTKVTTTLNLLAYAMLATFIVMRLFIKKRNRTTVTRSVIMLTLILVAAGDLIWVLASVKRSTNAVVQIFNAALIIFFVRAIREVWSQFMNVMVKSVPVFGILIAFFVMYTITGFILFANSEKSSDFATMNDSSYTIFIMFTISNYPDVQTPYFADNRLAFIYFWSFLLIGIFLLSNLLLATIFLNYKKLVNSKVKKYEGRVDDYFHKLFAKLEDGNGFIKDTVFIEALGGKEVIEAD